MGFLILALLLVLALAMAGVYVLIELPMLRRRARGAETPRIESDGGLRYPRRLEELERQLGATIEEARRQLAHLEVRATEVSAKDGRQELAGRYSTDARMLSNRIASMRRVLGLVWKTRMVLSFRAHLAATAESRPGLEGFPNGADPDAARTELAYEAAAADVRAFVARVERRARALEEEAGAEPPPDAEVTDALRAEIARELDEVRGTYAQLRERMDALADTYAYLADNLVTRRVAESSPGVAIEPGSEALLQEVADALAALDGMAELGDQQLADSLVDDLAEDIGDLEKAGLDAKAEADAALEVARLLNQLQRG
jgi:hypothetical protein